METFSVLLALCGGNSSVTGEFHSQRPVTRSFDVFFDLRLNKRLSKQSWCWWFETPSRSLWRHCNEICNDLTGMRWYQDCKPRQWLPGDLGLLPDTSNCRLRMLRECRERFPRHWLQRKPLVCDSGMHHGTCVRHVPWCMSGSLTRGGGENVPGIPGACTTRNLT